MAAEATNENQDRSGKPRLLRVASVRPENPGLGAAARGGVRARQAGDLRTRGREVHEGSAAFRVSSSHAEPHRTTAGGRRPGRRFAPEGGQGRARAAATGAQPPRAAATGVAGENGEPKAAAT